MRHVRLPACAGFSYEMNLISYTVSVQLASESMPPSRRHAQSGGGSGNSVWMHYICGWTEMHVNIYW